MGWISSLISVILHLDIYLTDIVKTYGFASYGILFAIIFAETGFVIAPFLPGDSMIFAAGALAAVGTFNILALFLVFSAAAILGDTVNYWIGSYLGDSMFKEDAKFFKKEYIDRTHKFFEKYGNKTIILARFVPVIRTFAPFLAGVGKMSYVKFLLYNVVGGLLWVSLFVFAGYYFGNIQLVKDNFSLVILIVIVVSLIPVFVELIKHRYSSKKK